MSFVLRSYQESSIFDIRSAFARGRKSIALVSPTGSGKTVIMTYIAHGATGKGNRMTIIVHRQELIRQTSAALNAMQVRHAIVAPGIAPQPDVPVQLAMIQTLVNRSDAIPPHLLMIDECHHSTSESYRQVVARFPAAKILGLTATPQRLDGKGLGSIFEELVIGPEVAELIAGGFLATPRYYAPPTELDMTGVRRTAGDFNRGQTAERVDRPKITGSAVEHYRKICPDSSAVAFCCSVRHAEHVRDQFITAGIPAATIDGTLSDEERIDRVAALTDGRIKVLTSVDVISEGFDLPAVGAAILLRPTESLALHLQQIGRVLRPKPDGSCAVILDHVGNCMRHGLAEESRQWTLEVKVGKRGPANGRQINLASCPTCYTVHVPSPACPNCQHIYPTQERKVAEVDGTLAQLTAAAIMAERERIQKRQAVGMAKTRGELEAIAKARGYSPKWVGMMLSLRARKRYAAKIDQLTSPQAEMKI